MSDRETHEPQAVMKGWLTGGGITDEAYQRQHERNVLICRANDRKTPLDVIGRAFDLHPTTIRIILAQNGRKPNVNPTPAGARDGPNRPGKLVRGYDPNVAAIRYGSQDLLVAILKMAVRNDIIPQGMTYDELRVRCLENGVAFPA